MDPWERMVELGGSRPMRCARFSAATLGPGARSGTGGGRSSDAIGMGALATYLATPIKVETGLTKGSETPSAARPPAPCIADEGVGRSQFPQGSSQALAEAQDAIATAPGAPTV